MEGLVERERVRESVREGEKVRLPLPLREGEEDTDTVLLPLGVDASEGAATPVSPAARVEGEGREVEEGHKEAAEDLLAEKHALCVRDTDLVRVPEAQRVFVTVAEPLRDGLRETHAEALLLKEDAMDGADSMDSPAAKVDPEG